MENQNHHYFASNAAQWRTDTDLFEVIKEMDKDKMNYAIFYLPIDQKEAYEIKNYKPVVEGAILLGMKRFDRKVARG